MRRCESRHLLCLILRSPAQQGVSKDGPRSASLTGMDGAWLYILRCSDDSFSDFRATVISLGRATFEAALRDPDTLLEVARAAGGELCEEDLNYVPSDVWGARTGGESRPSSVPHQEEPHGEDWGTDDLPRIVPKLWKAFGS